MPFGGRYLAVCGSGLTRVQPEHTGAVAGDKQRSESDVFFSTAVVGNDVYSLNVPVPGAVAARAGQVAAGLPGARERRRGEHTLVLKRFGDEDGHRAASWAREAVASAAPRPFEARVTRVAQFTEPPSGAAPVVYLAVESPAMLRLHEQLLETVPAVAAVEGEAYVPHVTIARGGKTVESVLGPVAPVRWTVTELVVWDGTHGEPIQTIALPA